MNGLFKRNEIDNKPKAEVEAKKDQDYDKLVQILKFDLKAQPTDKLKSPQELEQERLKNLKEAEEELVKRMDLINEAQKQDSNDFRKLKIIETSHRSVDDMDFNDFEYESFKQKQRNLRAIEEEKEEKEKIEKEKIVSKDELEEEEQQAEEIKIDKTESTVVLENEEWLKYFNKICNRLSSGKIKTEDFDKSVNEIIKKLNPGLNEKNKNRLYSLTQQLIEFYKITCLNKTCIEYEKLEVISKIIFHLCTVYLKEKTGDLFHSIINDLKSDNERSAMPNLDIVRHLL